MSSILRQRGFFDNVTPVNFNTVATPHLGLLRYPSFFSSLASLLGPRLLSRTGEQFYCVDKWSKRGRPLIEVMADPGEYSLIHCILVADDTQNAYFTKRLQHSKLFGYTRTPFMTIRSLILLRPLRSTMCLQDNPKMAWRCKPSLSFRCPPPHFSAVNSTKNTVPLSNHTHCLRSHPRPHRSL